MSTLFIPHHNPDDDLGTLRVVAAVEAVAAVESVAALEQQRLMPRPCVDCQRLGDDSCPACYAALYPRTPEAQP